MEKNGSKTLVKRPEDLKITQTLHPFKVAPRNLDQYKSSKLSYLLDDLQRFWGVPADAGAKLLMARGVSRAFVLRRRLFEVLALISHTQREACTAIANKSIRRPDKRLVKKIPAHVINYYKNLGAMEERQRTRRLLQVLLVDTGWTIPDNDSRFDKALKTSSASLIRALR